MFMTWLILQRESLGRRTISKQIVFVRGYESESTQTRCGYIYI